MGRNCRYFTECHNSAVTLIPYAKLALCAEHFKQYIENRVVKTIDKYHLLDLTKREKVLVALSGGKDSAVLLTILHKLYREKIDLSAFYVELGINHHQYSGESDRNAEELCHQLGIPFYHLNIKAEYGFDIDELHALNSAIVEGRIKPGNLQYRGICAFCGMIKRYAINKFAKDHGFTRVATGHNLTDESVSLIINFFNMNLNFLGRSHPLVDSRVEELVPRVKPLFYVTEQEVILYAYYARILHVSTECLYAKESPNLEIKRIFQELDSDRKGLFLGMMRQYQKKMLPLFTPAKGLVKPRTLTHCSSCGMAASSNKCSFCRNKSLLLARLNDLNLLQTDTEPNHKSDKNAYDQENKKVSEIDRENISDSDDGLDDSSDEFSDDDLD